VQDERTFSLKSSVPQTLTRLTNSLMDQCYGRDCRCYLAKNKNNAYLWSSIADYL